MKIKYSLVLMFILFIALGGISCERRVQAPERQSGTALPEDALMPAKVRTAEEIAEHDQVDDCWIIVNGNVYDITDFIPQHTGGSEQVTRWCGQDASEGFATKNFTGGKHAVTSILNLDAYFIGVTENN